MIPGIESFYHAFGGDLVPYCRVWNPTTINYIYQFAYQIGRKLQGYGKKDKLVYQKVN